MKKILLPLLILGLVYGYGLYQDGSFPAPISSSSGQTVLVAHNIDLAPRVRSLAEGDTVTFCGEFETSPQGGVAHWTHKDPRGSHTDGWLEHKGQRYQ